VLLYESFTLLSLRLTLPVDENHYYHGSNTTFSPAATAAAYSAALRLQSIAKHSYSETRFNYLGEETFN
jgi:hypothetical protein